MIFRLMPIIAVLLGSLPAGYAATLAARRLADSTGPSSLAMIAACALLGSSAAWIMPSLSLLAISCALGWVLLVLATVDAFAFRLPDILTLPLTGAGLAVAQWLPDRDLVGHTVAMLVAGLLFYAVAAAYRSLRRKQGLGLGDVKLAGAAGAWLGWQALPYVVLLASALGLVWVGVATIRRGRRAIQERIPFGIALCFAIWVIWLYGPPEFFGPLF
jgi:leader peptidase (prepilin peptidase)/N-methyltransferase